MRVADYIIDRLNKKYGIKYISLVTGNGSLVINDAIAKNPNVEGVFFNGEQSCGYFALGYSKYTNKLSVTNLIGGCGSTNAITSLLDAYQDHTPILFLSGNVALNYTTKNLKDTKNIKIKKFGVQELDIIEIVKPLTKYAVMITDKKMVKYELDKAIDSALTAPFSPVWIDLPADIGSSLINEEELVDYNKPQNIDDVIQILDSIEWAKELKQDLNTYKRPLILAGNGITLSGSREEFKQFIEKHNIPAIFTYGGKDLLDYNSSKNLGVVGLKPNRAAGFVLNNCDLLIILGCCLNICQTGYDGSLFAPKAKKYVVDINPIEHTKPHIKIDKIIECDLREFFKYV